METYEEYKDFFITKAKKIVNGFIVDEENDLEIELIVRYMMRDKKFEEINDRNGKSMNLSLNKGLCLIGSVGAGKTELMRVLQNCLIELKSPMAFQWTTPWQQANFWQENPKERREISKKVRTGDWMFDELGMKEHEKVSDYGRVFYMGELIVHESYENFRANLSFKHFTSNLTLAQISTEYSTRVRSRIERMCNVIPIYSKDRSNTAKPKEREFKKINLDEPEKITKEKRIKIKIDFLEDCFIKPYEIFLEMGDYSMAESTESLIYDELNKLGLIVLTIEEKTELYLKAKSSLLDDISKKFYLKESDRIKDIEFIEKETESSKEKIKSKSKSIALRNFVFETNYDSYQLREIIYSKVQEYKFEE